MSQAEEPGGAETAVRPFFEWDDSYRVNVAEIDHQHRRLIELISELHQAMTRNQGRHTVAAAIDELETMAAVLDELIDYTVNHFSREETFMGSYNYPDRTTHVSAHEDFVNRIQTFRRDYDDGKAVFSSDIVQFLKDWLIGHILLVDRKLGAFLNSSGIT